MEIPVTRDTIMSAFKVWSDATQLTFTEVKAGSNADILIQFASRYHQDGYPFDGKGSSLVLIVTYSAPNFYGAMVCIHLREMKE